MNMDTLKNILGDEDGGEATTTEGEYTTTVEQYRNILSGEFFWVAREGNEGYPSTCFDFGTLKENISPDADEPVWMTA